jgi:hypothetical protein
MRLASIAVLAATLVAALPASAQVYRWVDSRGVIHYSDTAPANASQVTRLDLVESRISIIPTAPRAAPGRQPPQVSLPPAPANFPGSTDQSTVLALESFADWRARCIAQRRVDCDRPSPATFDVSSFSPPYGMRVQ